MSSVPEWWIQIKHDKSNENKHTQKCSSYLLVEADSLVVTLNEVKPSVALLRNLMPLFNLV